ncbi:uncharacterized protein LOC133190923 [Saccostrea echinata]|uniref:uncharacterized protein LOC133190923 n=1 Tax=Saccostrea echinata TaxID=191078 RepID=UPI002A82B22E|nr:uncharacterized protein LOC133190923 [Saccostrea echinata]
MSCIGHESVAFLLDGHTNPSSAINQTCGTYNIYNKIDAIEKETQKKIHDMETMMRQVLLTVNQMDVKLENSNVHNMSLEIERLKKVVSNDVKNSTETGIGFTAKLTHSTYKSTTDVIKGNAPIFNSGNAYNGSVFTCPIQGLYFFHVSVLTNTDDSGAWIYKNSQQLTLAYTGYGPHFNGASVSVAIRLNIGDQVYLRPYSNSLNLDENSAFTGVKIN